jgi:hypothetical protein
MKALLFAGAASFLAAPAFAGPYVNIESNSGFVGSDYSSSVLETHVGYEGDLGSDAAWYVQAGPALIFPDGDDNTTELSGKIGASVGLTERLSAYGEVAAITSEEIDFDADLNVGVKAGLTFRF